MGTPKYIVEEMTVITVRLRARKLYLERAIRHLYPLELSCDIAALAEYYTFSAKAEEFRQRRDASEITKISNDLTDDDRERPLNK